MKELLDRALDAARSAGAAFAEARFVRTRRQAIEVKNGVPAVVDSESAGLGVLLRSAELRRTPPFVALAK